MERSCRQRWEAGSTQRRRWEFMLSCQHGLAFEPIGTAQYKRGLNPTLTFLCNNEFVDGNFDGYNLCALQKVLVETSQSWMAAKVALVRLDCLQLLQDWSYKSRRKSEGHNFIGARVLCRWMFLCNLFVQLVRWNFVV